MKLDILICTYNEGLYNIPKILLPAPHPCIHYIISHQVFGGSIFCLHNSLKPQREDVETYTIHSRGLSKNRNNALQVAKNDICLLADDDVRYKREYLDVVLDAFKRYPPADIITFQIQTPEGQPPFRVYQAGGFWHSRKSILNVASIEIAFRRQSIINAEIGFDERFGVGAKYPAGEEAIFLMDCLRRGLRARYVPHIIVEHPFESTKHQITKHLDEDLLKFVGAKFYRLFGWRFLILNIYSVIKNFSKYKNKISLPRALCNMYAGSWECMRGGI